MTASSWMDFGPQHIYRSFRAERNQALHRVLRRLPYEFVIALIEGLENADEITPGRLFAGDSGGCATGVTLRALDPSLRGRQFVRGRRLRRSVLRLRRSLAREVPHLYALEHVFDRSVEMLREEHPLVPKTLVAEATALWVAAEARTELVLRELDSQWIDGIFGTEAHEAVEAKPVQAFPSSVPALIAQPV